MNGISSAVWADMQAVKKWNMEVTRLLAVSPAARRVVEVRCHPPSNPQWPAGLSAAASARGD